MSTSQELPDVITWLNDTPRTQACASVIPSAPDWLIRPIAFGRGGGIGVMLMKVSSARSAAVDDADAVRPDDAHAGSPRAIVGQPFLLGDALLLADLGVARGEHDRAADAGRRRSRARSPPPPRAGWRSPRNPALPAARRRTDSRAARRCGRSARSPHRYGRRISRDCSAPARRTIRPASRRRSRQRSRGLSRRTRSAWRRRCSREQAIAVPIDVSSSLNHTHR